MGDRSGICDSSIFIMISKTVDMALEVDQSVLGQKTFHWSTLTVHLYGLAIGENIIQQW